MEIQQAINQKSNVNVNKEVNNVKRYNVNAETIARQLADKLDDQKSFLYFCKVAHQLNESQIWSNLEQAQKGRNPRAYFAFLCNLSMSANHA